MKFGIVGTGAMVERFLQAVEGKVEGVVFVAAHSPNAIRRESFAQKHPSIRCYADYSRMLTDPEVEAVYIATPVDTHMSLTQEAASLGKHVLCEKPMALTLQECTEMVTAARDNGVVLQIAYMMRYHPSHQYIREQIGSGSLGKIQFVHLERTAFSDFKSPDFPSRRMWFVDKSKSGGGAFMDLGSHLLDLLIYFMGDEFVDYKLSAAIDGDLGVELSGLARLKFQDGALATVYASWEVLLHDNLIQVYGDKASIQAVRTIGPYTDGQVARIEGSQRQIVDIPHKNHYVGEVEHFQECVREEKEPLTSGSVSLKTESLRLKLFETLI
jgi:1,5-anhydro-D-fructose reductase (1,5-anhydro-D-mannitol-forming)